MDYFKIKEGNTMKNKKENKIRLVLVFMIFLAILIAFIYLKQNKNILREEETHHTETVTQLERITMSGNDMKETDGGKVSDPVFGADAGGGDVEAVRGVTIWRE